MLRSQDCGLLGRRRLRLANFGRAGARRRKTSKGKGKGKGKPVKKNSMTPHAAGKEFQSIIEGAQDEPGESLNKQARHWQLALRLRLPDQNDQPASLVDGRGKGSVCHRV